MKQTIFTLVLLAAYLNMFSNPVDIPESKSTEVNYVLTDTSITYFHKIRKGFSDRLIAKKYGEKTVYNMDDVIAYRKDGKEFVKKFVVKKNSYTVEALFLQKICTCAGYTLFKKLKGANEPLHLNDFYVYKGDIQMYQLDQENYQVILKFFFPKFNEMFS